MADDVLHLGVMDVAVLAAEIVEGWDLVEEPVGDCDDDDDADGEGPEHDGGDHVGVAVAGLVVPPLRVRVWERLLVDAS